MRDPENRVRRIVPDRQPVKFIEILSRNLSSLEVLRKRPPAAVLVIAENRH